MNWKAWHLPDLNALAVRAPVEQFRAHPTIQSNPALVPLERAIHSSGALGQSKQDCKVSIRHNFTLPFHSLYPTQERSMVRSYQARRTNDTVVGQPKLEGILQSVAKEPPDEPFPIAPPAASLLLCMIAS
jgi:hypothetical protein